MSAVGDSLADDSPVRMTEAEYLAFEEQAERQSLKNSSVVFEVLSLTEAYDRGEKFCLYARIPSLRDFVLISSDRSQVEIISVNPPTDGDVLNFRLRVVEGLAAVAPLPSPGVELRLAEIDRQVDFTGAATKDESSEEGQTKEQE